MNSLTNFGLEEVEIRRTVEFITGVASFEFQTRIFAMCNGNFLIFGRCFRKNKEFLFSTRRNLFSNKDFKLQKPSLFGERVFFQIRALTHLKSFKKVLKLTVI